MRQFNFNQNQFQSLENAMKRAVELSSVQQHEAALNLLHQAISTKRYRSNQDAALMALMMLYVSMCVEHDKPQLARDGLHRYRAAALKDEGHQNLQKVLEELRDKAEKRLSDSKAALEGTPVSQVGCVSE
eukprot:GHVN01056203.1.p1 GENE.GHVN01056203.1~~GHVN01056203.1.p1  ORF type:complete len:130 (+),score=33.86 GHVN01056203.1:228-617(+)